MKERPIIMSAPMVRGILEDRKTQTRRIVKVLRHGYFPSEEQESLEIQGMECMETNEPGYFVATGGRTAYAVGDRLWLRETFAVEPGYDGFKPSDIDPSGDHLKIWYRADAWYPQGGLFVDHPKGNDHGRWHPGRFMPRWASRITLELTEVRVDRLQQISAEDCIAEGMVSYLRGQDAVCDLRGQYRELWDSLNKRAPWDSNPWVWVLVFRNVTDA